MTDTNGTTVGAALTDLGTGIWNLDSTAILTVFWYLVLVAVGVYSLYRAAAFLRTWFPSIGTRLRRARRPLPGRKR